MCRTHPEIHCPSDRDTEASIAGTIAALADAHRVLDGKEGQLGLRAEVEILGGRYAPFHKQQHLTTMEKIVSHDEERIKRMRELDRDFGRVFASSGLTRAYGKQGTAMHETTGKQYNFQDALDWALVRVKPSRMRSNGIAPETLVMYSNFEYCDTIMSARAALPQVGEQIFKKGRNGPTVGIVSKIRKDINFKKETPLTYYRAWVVMGMATPQGRLPFMQGGDSGCWCLDRAGNIVGLGFAGCDDINSGYLIPISDVYADIERQTGAKVVEPVLS